MDSTNNVIQTLGDTGLFHTSFPKPIAPIHSINKRVRALGMVATGSGLFTRLFTPETILYSRLGDRTVPYRRPRRSNHHRLTGFYTANAGQSQPAQFSTNSSLSTEATLSADSSALIAAKFEQLANVVSRSNEVLASATTVFPFTLFRDDIVVDRTKVTITKRNFFFTSEIMSIRIEDILNVKVSLGPFLGSLTLAVRVMSSEDHHSINYFWRKDAIHLKHVIQGYIIAHHNNIDCRDQDKAELVKTLTKLGHDINS